ncbi:MAG: 50S ribosomal protein L13 [Candidatus Paceibacterota bacterium]
MTTKTAAKTEKMTHTFDAGEFVLGRLATEIATILMGKHRADYTPNMPGTDRVVVTNAANVKVTGNKEKGKVYQRHTGFMGGLKERRLEEVRAKNPTEIIRMAVYNMLPKNKLRTMRMKRLKIEA